MIHQSLFRSLLIIVGLIVFFMAAGMFILRLLAACFGLYLVYLGLRGSGSPFVFARSRRFGGNQYWE